MVPAYQCSMFNVTGRTLCKFTQRCAVQEVADQFCSCSVTAQKLQCHSCGRRNAQPRRPPVASLFWSGIHPLEVHSSGSSGHKGRSACHNHSLRCALGLEERSSAEYICP